MRTGGDIGWAIRKRSPQLKAAVDAFIARHATGTLATLGLDLTEFVAGPLAATVTARLDRQGKSTVQATVNLQEAQLTLPWLDWHKPAHAPGEAEGTVQLMGSQTPAQGTFRVDFPMHSLSKLGGDGQASFQRQLYRTSPVKVG